jgi:DNA-binding response OmpR family regulator
VTDNSAHHVRLLIAEDNPADVLIIRHALRQKPVDFDVHVVQDGEEAVRYLDAMEGQLGCGIDLLILDLNLPRKTGLEVLERLKSSKCSGAKVLILSSSNSPEDRAASYRLGAARYFRKPANLDDFMKIGDLLVELATES